MTHEEYKAAANHWIEKDAASQMMPAAQLWVTIENYIQANNTCALATGSGSFIRCTPIEYAWHDGAFWMFSEGGQKFVGLEENKSVCLAIYDRYDGFGRLKGMQVSGRAEIVEPFSPEYVHAAEWKKIPVDALKKLPFTMNLIKITPTEIEFLNSDFKEDGYDSRQHYDCGREEAEKQHPPEKVIFMNMCMLCDGDQVLALDKTGSSYNGTTFPGGHVEAGETFSEAVVREMKEETGLTIHHPVLKGIYHWYRDGLHNVGLLYRADSYEGELKSSEEGQVYWISREEYEKKELAAGMPRVLQIMDDDNLTECFEELQPDGSFLEHLF